MLYSFANALFICFGVYAAIASLIVIIALIKDLPDFLSDTLDAIVTTSARVVRPGASKEQVDNWCDTVFMYFLLMLAIGFMLLLGKGLALIIL